METELTQKKILGKSQHQEYSDLAERMAGADKGLAPQCPSERERLHHRVTLRLPSQSACS